MARKVVTLTVVMWIGLAGLPAHAASGGGGSWTAAVISWLVQAFSGVVRFGGEAHQQPNYL